MTFTKKDLRVVIATQDHYERMAKWVKGQPGNAKPDCDFILRELAVELLPMLRIRGGKIRQKCVVYPLPLCPCSPSWVC